MEESCFDLEEQEEIKTISLDDLYNNLKIYELEIIGSSSTISLLHTQSNPTSGDNLSDAVICAFLVSQPNSPQMSRKDLEQIDPDDLEEMDLQWEMAMLTIRARRFIKRTGGPLDVNGQRVDFDTDQVGATIVINMVTLQENVDFQGIRRKEKKRIIENNYGQWKIPMINACCSKNLELEGGSSSSSDSEVDSCSKSCVKAYATLKEQYDSLSSDYRKSLTSFKLTRIECINSSTAASLFYDAFVNSSEIDVKTVESNLESAGVKNNGDAVEPKTIRKNRFRPPVIKDWNSDDKSKVEIILKDKTVSSSTKKIKLVKIARETVKKIETSKQNKETVKKIETSKQNKHYPRGNQRNWNNLMSQRLGSNFKMINKACYVCGSFEHLHYVRDNMFKDVCGTTQEG
ncbi:hypothetical protein Tco_1048156 [Tanacetum coccineum]